MSQQFVAYAARCSQSAVALGTRLARVAASMPQLKNVFSNETVTVAAVGLATRVTSQGDGVIIGSVRSAVAAAPSHPSSIREGPGGQDLIGNTWGHYIAFLSSPADRLDVVRAPLGALPCYWVETAAGLIFASAPKLLRSMVDRPLNVNWEAVARHLAFAQLRPTETCITGIEELRGGERLTVKAGDLRREALWSPWSFADPAIAIYDRRDAISLLRKTVVQCVDAATEGHDRILLKLSGGLDSSIIAACLKEAGVDFSALTLNTDDVTGDERGYARIVASHLNIPLVERRRDPTRLDLIVSPSANLARPSIPAFRQESDRLTHAAAESAAATLIMDGGGGDNVFCALQSAAPAADCFSMRGARQLLRTADSIARLAHVSTMQVLHHAARRSLDAQRDHRWPTDGHLLSPRAIESVPGRPRHPWLRSPRGAPPGRAAHVALIVGAQSYVEAFDPEASVPLDAPLLSQPLVELCLRIPSWLWFDAGHNRALARHAFADALPPEIIFRRSKGSPSSFIAEVLETNRSTVRDRLLGGLLAQADIVDAEALAIKLRPGAPISNHDLHRIMGLFDAEVWARHWCDQ